MEAVEAIKPQDRPSGLGPRLVAQGLLGERDLERARPTDFSGADTSSINIGTKIKLKIDGGGEREMTMLGAWDADPEKHVVSYLSEIGQILVGKSIGESVEIRDTDTEEMIKVTVESIEAI